MLRFLAAVAVLAIALGASVAGQAQPYYYPRPFSIAPAEGWSTLPGSNQPC